MWFKVRLRWCSTVFVIFKRQWLSVFVHHPYSHISVHVQSFDCMHLQWELVSASYHYELNLEVAPTERGGKLPSLHTRAAGCSSWLSFSHLSPQPGCQCAWLPACLVAHCFITQASARTCLDVFCLLPCLICWFDLSVCLLLGCLSPPDR